MANQNEGNIVERSEMMKSFSSFNRKRNFGQFLTPSATFVDGAQPDIPSNSTLPPNSSTRAEINLVFNGWKHPQKKWKIWYERMQPLYQPIWERAGIHNALKNSTYQIQQNENVILGFSERWCSKTQSFVFPWGESTITLEDVMILGGYPVVGNSVSGSSLTSEEESCFSRLDEERKKLVDGPSRKATQSAWFKAFMDVGSGLEHEAFLSLWLSRFVFPTTCDSVAAVVLPIAVRLARGERIALAPPLLARIYHDLDTVKTSIGHSSASGETKSITTWAPFILLQVWVWERFHRLRPEPNFVENGEPRLGRWDKKKKKNVEDIRFAIDSAAQRFYWRPYVATDNNPVSRQFYREREEWMGVDNNLELESYDRCMRVGELVGIDGKIHQYLPHRVARQFGLDQDVPGVPGHVQANGHPGIAWSNKFQIASSSMAGGGDFQQVKCEMEPINMSTELAGRPKKRTSVTVSDEDKGSWDGTTFMLPETKLDARVSRLERLVGALKAAKRDGRLRKVS